MVSPRKSQVLSGHRVVVGRLRPGPSKVTQQLKALGADVVEAPQVKILPPSDNDYMNECLLHNHPGRPWVFSSPVSVDYFFSRLTALQRDIRQFTNPYSHHWKRNKGAICCLRGSQPVAQ